VRLPRNLSGMELVVLLRRHYGYNLIRQRGSHMRLASTYMGYEHHVSVPRHNPLRLGTLDRIFGDVAEYLDIDEDELKQELFGK
jgi:predicted RNA binding protein YcfA (HicA-like mRNA interferase family)